MLEHADAQLGRLVDFLSAIGVLDDTLLVVISDNGASREGSPMGTVNALRFFNLMAPVLDQELAEIPLIGTVRQQQWPARLGHGRQHGPALVQGDGARRRGCDPLVVHWARRITNTDGQQPSAVTTCRTCARRE